MEDAMDGRRRLGARPSRTRAAHMTVARAIQSGRIVRPDACEKCGTVPGLTKNGRAKTHAHHPRGYSDPLDVEWICFKCHRNEPGHAAKGEKHGMAKLTPDQVLAIRSPENSIRSSSALALEYGVRRQNIILIRKARSWRHV